MWDRCPVCGGPAGECQQEYLTSLITSRTLRTEEAPQMGDTITAHEHIYRDITAPDGSSAQRELAYVPGDEIPVADAKALGVGSNGRTAGSVEDKARRGPKSKSKDDDAKDGDADKPKDADATSEGQ